MWKRSCGPASPPPDPPFKYTYLFDNELEATGFIPPRPPFKHVYYFDDEMPPWERRRIDYRFGSSIRACTWTEPEIASVERGSIIDVEPHELDDRAILRHYVPQPEDDVNKGLQERKRVRGDDDDGPDRYSNGKFLQRIPRLD
jgi:hypothetical protein